MGQATLETLEALPVWLCPWLGIDLSHGAGNLLLGIVSVLHRLEGNNQSIGLRILTVVL